ncbi:MAG: hypothetical protein RIT45_3790 [Pseudomonadota bacterium]|jgi:outer membrane lipoprotein-sorting protein
MACVAALLLLGCGAERGRPTTGPQTADDVLSAALGRTLPKTLSGTARMEAYVDGKARKADLLVMIERPDRAQLQAMTPTMEMVAVLATDGQRFTSFERGGQQCSTGRACARNMARLVPIAMPPTDLVSAMLGRPPMLEGATRSLRWDSERKAWKVTLVRAPWQQELWVRPPAMHILASVMSKDGKRFASVAYGDHGKLGPDGPPRKLRMRAAGDKIDVSIELRDVDLNEPIEADAFTVPCPRGMPVIELPCETTAAGDG